MASIEIVARKIDGLNRAHLFFVHKTDDGSVFVSEAGPDNSSPAAIIDGVAKLVATDWTPLGNASLATQQALSPTNPYRVVLTRDPSKVEDYARGISALVGELNLGQFPLSRSADIEFIHICRYHQIRWHT